MSLLSWIRSFFAYEDRCFTVHVISYSDSASDPPRRGTHYALSLAEALGWFDTARDSGVWDGGMIYDMAFDAVDWFGDLRGLNKPRRHLPSDYVANLRRNKHLAGIGT